MKRLLVATLLVCAALAVNAQTGPGFTDSIRVPEGGELASGCGSATPGDPNDYCTLDDELSAIRAAVAAADGDLSTSSIADLGDVDPLTASRCLRTDGSGNVVSHSADCGGGGGGPSIILEIDGAQVSTAVSVLDMSSEFCTESPVDGLLCDFANAIEIDEITSLLYSPAASGDWTSWTTAPTQAKSALDKLAARPVDTMSTDCPDGMGVVATGGAVSCAALAETAPGVVGDAATLDTLEFLWGVERVPFPHKIDSGQWTDYYFSAEAGGDWGLGNDANDGLTPQAPKRTLAAALTTCFGGSFRRCNFDNGDSWTDANGGYAGGFHTITDAQITIGSCDTSIAAVYEQPCFWFRSSPGGRAVWDATGTASTNTTFSFQPIADRSSVLIEGIDIIGDSAGSSGAPLETFQAGVLYAVGGDYTLSKSGSASSQVVVPHHVGAIHMYGPTTIGYSGAPTGGRTIDQNGSSGLALHTRGTVTGPPITSSQVLSVGQEMGATLVDASLAAEQSADPSVSFVSGAHLRSHSSSTGASGILRAQPDDQDDNSNSVVGIFISTLLNNQSSGASAPLFIFNGTFPANGTADFTLLWPTFLAVNSSANVRGLQISAGIVSSNQFNVAIAGCVIEPGPALHRFISITDTDWAASTSTLKIRDCVHDTTDWQINAAGGNCFHTTPAAAESCINALRATPVSISTNMIEDATGAFTDANGECVDGEPCKAMISGSLSDYSIDIPYKVQIPSFMAGRRIARFHGMPEVFHDAGRQESF